MKKNTKIIIAVVAVIVVAGGIGRNSRKYLSKFRPA